MVTVTEENLIPEAFREIVLERPLDASDLGKFPDDGNRYEIIGGHLIVSPSPTYRHQHVSMKLGNALDTYLTSKRSGTVVAAPMDVHLSSRDVVQPDLLVVLEERAEIIQNRGILGAPDLIIEILSPSSMETDFLRKSKLYERFGVKEYWIVNPENETISVQTLEGDRFELTGEYSRDETLRSTMLDAFELELSSIFPITVDTLNATKETQPTHDE